ncbi:MAG: hypothetical protein ACN4GR_08040 [Arenicellales bacterium]
MFIRVVREDQGLHFTVVDILRKHKEQELEMVLDLGVIQHGDMNGQQAWYVIAENLLASELLDNEKCIIARDIANWLPPLSREGLLRAREEDLRQLSALCEEYVSEKPAILATLSEDDPLTIIADWLDAEGISNN